jgi:hypothetical protein
LVVLCAGSTLLLAQTPRHQRHLLVPLPKLASNNFREWFLSPTGRLNLGIITEGKLTAVLIIPSSWGFPTGPVRHQSPHANDPGGGGEGGRASPWIMGGLVQDDSKGPLFTMEGFPWGHGGPSPLTLTLENVTLPCVLLQPLLPRGATPCMGGPFAGVLHLCGCHRWLKYPSDHIGGCRCCTISQHHLLRHRRLVQNYLEIILVPEQKINLAVSRVQPLHIFWGP